MNDHESSLYAENIAVIGMRGRFPGAPDTQALWKNLRNGVESITFFTDDELKSAGIGSDVLALPGYVGAGAVLGEVDMFDALFFGFSARDAEIMDPQQRVFLECAWESLEVAGYDPEKYMGLISVFAGADMSTYMYNIYANMETLGYIDGFQMAVGNDKDHLTTHVSYKLNLKGPSVVVQTACSTSLVAVCLACQSLLTYQSDIALAGGVAINVPQRKGYLYQPGGISSPDGHCRTFDAAAMGTVIGNGCGIVVLKRLSEALRDGDHIHAVIKGSALNNDGAAKIGYTAPGIEGQAQVVAMAQALAGVDPETIGYMEAHGTATPLGDPIEVAALTQAFNARTTKKGFCAIGAVKSNLGHLSSAAGITGLIKTILALENKEIPPSLHYTTPNPQIDFANSPFYVNTELKKWDNNGTPRRAATSSFGIGGTNAHVILEEAPATDPSGPARPYQLLAFSAKTTSALEAITDNLAAHLKQHPELNLADVAYSYQVGRKAFPMRRVVVCEGVDNGVAADRLEDRDPLRVVTSTRESVDRPILFMFPGQGTQHPNMALELYQTEPRFRTQVDLCCDGFKPHLGLDLREVLYPSAEGKAEAAERLKRTSLTQPALFTIEYALAKLWMEWGIHPTAMIGHSIGEYVAACLSGVFSLEDVLDLVATRGQLMERMSGGSMLSVPLSETEAMAYVNGEINLSAINAPSMCVLSGSTEAIHKLEQQLTQAGVTSRLLQTSHAFHSAMMDPIVDEFVQKLRGMELNVPAIPFVSNLTGDWIMAETATNPSYWGRHLRQAVRFADGMARVLTRSDWFFLETGPGQTLCTLARQQGGRINEQIILSSLPSVSESRSDLEFILTTLGQLWLAGAEVSWSEFHKHTRRLRVPLPTYPFERQRYWIGPPEYGTAAAEGATASVDGATAEVRDIARWFYLPSWKPAIPSSRNGDQQKLKKSWLVFRDGPGFAAQFVSRLEEKDQSVITVVPGEEFTQLASNTFAINPRRRSDYDALLNELSHRAQLPEIVAHFWGVTAEGKKQPEIDFDSEQYAGFYSLIFLAQALEKEKVTAKVQIGAISNQLQLVLGDESLSPAKATMLAGCKVISQEYPNLRCRSVDIVLGEGKRATDDKLVDSLISELTAGPFDAVVAYRRGRRWIQTYEAANLPETTDETVRFRQKGVYLITGGMGNIGMALSEILAKRYQAKLVLTGRSTLPQRSEWPQIAASGSDDNVAQKIRRILALEEFGAEVLVLSADSSSLTQMRQVVDETNKRFGSLHGVIHGAGNVSEDAFYSVNKIDAKAGEMHFRPKVKGLVALEEAVRGKQLDFCLLLSSLSAVLGGVGLGAYAAANAYLDAFAMQQNQLEAVPWISVNWDAWHFPTDGNEFKAGYGDFEFILPHEGADAFCRIVERAPAQVVVSTTDLHARLKKWVNLESLRDDRQGAKEQTGNLHQRPNLTSQFVAPRTATEESIAAVWQTLLGVSPVGIYDKFFELGGHSLLAIQLISRLRELFPSEIPVQRIFEAPTVAQLAESIEKDLEAASAQEEAGPEADNSIAEILSLVEGMSETEVTELLSQQKGLA